MIYVIYDIWIAINGLVVELISSSWINSWINGLLVPVRERAIKVAFFLTFN